MSHKTVKDKTYGTNGHQHGQVAHNDDEQRKYTTCKHQGNHVGLNSRVITSTEDIRTTGSLQSMGPKPDTGE